MKLNLKKRMYIYLKDVEQITGKKSSYCRNVISLIRLVNGKKKHQGVTVNGYCDYMDAAKEEIEAFL